MPPQAPSLQKSQPQPVPPPSPQRGRRWKMWLTLLVCAAIVLGLPFGYSAYSRVKAQNTMLRVHGLVAAIESFYHSNNRFPTEDEITSLYPNASSIEGFEYHGGSLELSSPAIFTYRVRQKDRDMAVGEPRSDGFSYSGYYAVVACDTFDVCESGDYKKVGTDVLPVQASFVEPRESGSMRMFIASSFSFSDPERQTVRYDPAYFRASREFEGTENELLTLTAGVIEPGTDPSQFRYGTTTLRYKKDGSDVELQVEILPYPSRCHRYSFDPTQLASLPASSRSCEKIAYIQIGPSGITTLYGGGPPALSPVIPRATGPVILGAIVSPKTGETWKTGENEPHTILMDPETQTYWPDDTWILVYLAKEDNSRVGYIYGYKGGLTPPPAFQWDTKGVYACLGESGCLDQTIPVASGKYKIRIETEDMKLLAESGVFILSK